MKKVMSILSNIAEFFLDEGDVPRTKRQIMSQYYKDPLLYIYMSR